MTIAFIQLHAREKDVATLSVCIRVKKPMAQKKVTPSRISRLKAAKNWSKPGQIRSKLAGIEKSSLTSSTNFFKKNRPTFLIMVCIDRQKYFTFIVPPFSPQSRT
jgi:hypothetical protein